VTSDVLVNSSELRKALGTFATGVTVLTACSNKGEMTGLTVNSFTSVSLSPPLILWCLASTSDSLSIFRSAEYFAVNILASGQRDISNHFATKQVGKFNNIKFKRGLGDAPLLQGCVTWLQCKTVKLYEEGDHWIFIGEVVELKTTSKEGLIFNQSNYAISLPLPANDNESGTPSELLHSDSESYFSLLFQAIHSYQENFEQHQHEIIESDYKARILCVLNHYNSTTITEMHKVIKIPKSEIEIIIHELISSGLVETITNSENNALRLTQSGKEKSNKLLLILHEHDEKINQLLGEDEYQQFRVNLQKIIDWNY